MTDNGVKYPLWMDYYDKTPEGNLVTREQLHKERLAWNLLWEYLTEQQRLDIIELTAFDVISQSGNHYRILDRGTLYRTVPMDNFNRQRYSHLIHDRRANGAFQVMNERIIQSGICVHFGRPARSLYPRRTDGRGNYPMGDVVLGKKLMLEHAEHRLLRAAGLGW